MGVKASESVTASFTTQTPSTGAATDADSTPTGTFRRNGTNDGAVTVTVTNMATGDYKAAFTMPAGASEGDECELIISATVGGVTGKARIWHDTCVSKLPGDFNDVSQADITGGAYALDTDANGRTRIVVGTAAGEINSSSGKVPATVAAGDLANDSITAAALAASAAAEIADAVWDEATSGHGGSASFGKLLIDNLGDIPKIDGSVNDASATTTSFVVASSLSSSNDFYNGSVIAFTTGTLTGVARRITDYVGSSRTVTVSPALPSAPANGVEFIIIGRID